jgi:hypothetical protein
MMATNVPVLPSPLPASPVPAEEVTRKAPDDRKEALARAVHTQIAQGARVESQSDYSAVLAKGHRPNHVLHFIIGLFTLGLWWLVWIVLAIFGGEKRMSVGVDEWGNTNVQKL